MQYQKTAETTGDLIGNKITDRITKFSSQQNNSETVTNGNNIDLPKEKYISRWQKIIDEMRLI